MQNPLGWRNANTSDCRYSKIRKNTLFFANAIRLRVSVLKNIFFFEHYGWLCTQTDIFYVQFDTCKCWKTYACPLIFGSWGRARSLGPSGVLGTSSLAWTKLQAKAGATHESILSWIDTATSAPRCRSRCHSLRCRVAHIGVACAPCWNPTTCEGDSARLESWCRSERPMAACGARMGTIELQRFWCSSLSLSLI